MSVVQTIIEPNNCFKQKKIVKVDILLLTGENLILDLCNSITINQLKIIIEQKTGIVKYNLCITDINTEIADNIELRTLESSDDQPIKLYIVPPPTTLPYVLDNILEISDYTIGQKAIFGGRSHCNFVQNVSFIPNYSDLIIICGLSGTVSIYSMINFDILCSYQLPNVGHHLSCTVSSDSLLLGITSNDIATVLQIIFDSHGIPMIIFSSLIGHNHNNLIFPLCSVFIKNKDQQETILISDCSNHYISQFDLNGQFIRIFAGVPSYNIATDFTKPGEFTNPYQIKVLYSQKEVAIVDNGSFKCRSRIQFFDIYGNYKRYIIINNNIVDLLFDRNDNIIIIDHCKKLSVFNSNGEYICSRLDIHNTKLGWNNPTDNNIISIAFRPDDGCFAVGNGRVFIWNYSNQI
ncbi:hypothetical protein N9T73_00260 [bacterium]|nr:hypothetical protein [bacterium]